MLTKSHTATDDALGNRKSDAGVATGAQCETRNLHTPYVLQALKYATFTTVSIIIVIGIIALMDGSEGSLTGRLVTPQQNGTIPTVHFDENRAQQGFTVPTDTHAIFVVPNGTRIPRITFFGGQDIDQAVRYWGYCFSGNEQENKQQGKRGKAIYDGQYFYSMAERQEQQKRPKPADNDLVGIKDAATTPATTAAASIAEIFYGGQTCYVMVDGSTVSGGLPAGLDDDGDDLNNMREAALGTNPSDGDTDRDGLADAVEVLKGKTNPAKLDSDDDGLPDGCEDKNRDGIYDRGETSPLVADTDRDTLCDGNGFAPGCPEPKQTVCYQNANNERECQARPSSPVFGEDMNQNCKVDGGQNGQAGETDPTNPATFGIDDWQYKWNQFQAKQTR